MSTSLSPWSLTTLNCWPHVLDRKTDNCTAPSWDLVWVTVACTAVTGESYWTQEAGDLPTCMWDLSERSVLTQATLSQRCTRSLPFRAPSPLLLLPLRYCACLQKGDFGDCLAPCPKTGPERGGECPLLLLLKKKKKDRSFTT